MLAEKIVGVWSIDELYAPGAQSDDLLIFGSDGQGRLEVLNWGYGSVSTFEWKVEEDRLSIGWLKSYQNMEGVDDFIEETGVEARTTDQVTAAIEIGRAHV